MVSQAGGVMHEKAQGLEQEMARLRVDMAELQLQNQASLSAFQHEMKKNQVCLMAILQEIKQYQAETSRVHLDDELVAATHADKKQS